MSYDLGYFLMFLMDVECMYRVAKLKLRLMAEGENKTDDIDQLLSIMYYNGLILNNYIVKEENDELFAYVTTTDDDSLNKKYYNSYLKEQSKNNGSSI